MNADRGGSWHAEHLPPPDVETLAAEVAALRRRILALEANQNATPAFTRSSAQRFTDLERKLHIRRQISILARSLCNCRHFHMLQRVPAPGVWPRVRPSRKKGISPLPLGWVELPHGWIAVTTFSENHGLHIRSTKRRAVRGSALKLPVRRSRGAPTARAQTSGMPSNSPTGPTNCQR